MGNGKYFCTCNSTTPFRKESCVVHVDRIVYYKAIVFEEMSPPVPFTCTINSKRYDSLFCNQVIPTAQQRACLDRIIFVKDIGPPYIAMSVMLLLKAFSEVIELSVATFQQPYIQDHSISILMNSVYRVILKCSVQWLNYKFS